MDSLISKAKEASPTVAIVAGVLSVAASNTAEVMPPFVTPTLAAWVSLGALALHVAGIFAKKTAP